MVEYRSRVTREDNKDTLGVELSDDTSPFVDVVTDIRKEILAFVVKPNCFEECATDHDAKTRSMQLLHMLGLEEGWSLVKDDTATETPQRTAAHRGGVSPTNVPGLRSYDIASSSGMKNLEREIYNQQVRECFGPSALTGSDKEEEEEEEKGTRRSWARANFSYYHCYRYCRCRSPVSEKDDPPSLPGG